MCPRSASNAPHPPTVARPLGAVAHPEAGVAGQSGGTSSTALRPACQCQCAGLSVRASVYGSLCAGSSVRAAWTTRPTPQHQSLTGCAVLLCAALFRLLRGSMLLSYVRLSPSPFRSPHSPIRSPLAARTLCTSHALHPLSSAAFSCALRLRALSHPAPLPSLPAPRTPSTFAGSLPCLRPHTLPSPACACLRLQTTITPSCPGRRSCCATRI